MARQAQTAGGSAASLMGRLCPEVSINPQTATNEMIDVGGKASIAGAGSVLRGVLTFTTQKDPRTTAEITYCGFDRVRLDGARSPDSWSRYPSDAAFSHTAKISAGRAASTYACLLYVREPSRLL